MFLPFLLYVMAMTAATLWVVLPDASHVPPDAWRAFLALLLPWVAAWLLGLGSERWLGSRRPMRLGRRRLMALLIWGASVGLTPLPATLVSWLGNLAFSAETALTLLLLHYWITDTLSLQPPHMLGQEGPPAPARAFLQALRVPTPLLILVFVGLSLSSATQALLDGAGSDDTGRQWWTLVWPTLSYVLSAAVLMPVLLRIGWGLHPLRFRGLEDVIGTELKANGVRVSRILAWPDALTGHMTAGVIGIVPGFRYLLFSEALAAALTEEEVRSITAHEAAHLKFRHLWYYLAAVLAAVLLVQTLWRLMALGGLWLGVELPAWAIAIVELTALLAFLRSGWGYLSRSFERQADVHALRRVGLPAFQSAIAKVALINGIPPGEANWHHHGIGDRIAYLSSSDIELLAYHDSTVVTLKRICVALLVLGIGAQWLFEASPLVDRVTERYLAERLDARGQPGQSDLPALHQVAMLAYQRQDLAQAERYFRAILVLTPNDARVQNNLAWLLVTKPNADRAAVIEAVDLARRASAADPSAYILDTLAEAYARSDRRDLAREAARQALNLAEEGKGRGEASLRYYRERLEGFRAQPGA